MCIFLLAGSEVFLSALVLAISNFLCMRKKSSTPPDKLEDFVVRAKAKTEIFSETEFAPEEDVEEEVEKRAKEEQKKEVEKNEAEEREGNEDVEEVTSVGADSQEEEKFLKKPQLNGDASSSPETRL